MLITKLINIITTFRSFIKTSIIVLQKTFKIDCFKIKTAIIRIMLIKINIICYTINKRIKIKINTQINFQIN